MIDFLAQAFTCAWWLPPVAVVADLALADPPHLPHPVQGIAFLAARLEVPARRTHYPILAGGATVLLLLLLTGAVVTL